MKKYTFLLNICGLFFLFVISGFGQNHTLSEVKPKIEARTIDLGQSLTREISGGERHIYKIKLSEKQFVKIEAEQTNCDIILALQTPENLNAFEFKDDNFRNGSETQTAAIEISGEYELRVVSFEKPDLKGKYTLKFSELRPATEKELSQTSGFLIVDKLSKIEKESLTTEQIYQMIEKFEIALGKFRFAENRSGEAVMLSSIASNHIRLGNYRKGDELNRQALEIYRSLNNNKEILFLLSNMGNSYLYNNELQKALEIYYQANELAIKNEDIFFENKILNAIGKVYEDSGNFSLALSYYLRALEKAEKSSQIRAVAFILNDLGTISYKLNDNQKAVEYFQKAVETARNIKIKRLEAAILGNLGQTYFALGSQAKATEFLTEALTINRSLNNKIGEASILHKFGKIQLKLEKFDEAISYFNQSQEIYRSTESTQSLAETLLLTAKAEAKKGLFETAQTKTEEAISLIEKIRSRVQITDLRDSFSVNLQDYYGFYVEVLMARHKLEPNKNFAVSAFKAGESARARGLLNLLAESKTDIRQGADSKLLEQETEIKNLLSARLENLTKILGGKPKAETVAGLRTEIEKIRLEYSRIQNQIRTSSPHYTSLTQPKILSLSEIQTEVLDTDSILLEYVLGETKSFLWIVGKTEFQVIELPAKSEIEKKARQFYEALTARNRQVKFETNAERENRILIADSIAKKLSVELGQMIVAPASPFSANKRLLIVADGVLQYIPFAALQIANQKNKFQYLVETNEIVNLPSASALASLRRETANRPPAPKTLAILADPIFDKSDERFLTISGSKKNKTEPKIDYVSVSKKQTRAITNLDTRNGILQLPRLLFTRREADSIAALVPNNQREKLLDFDADRQSAMSLEPGKYRFVHFATHGFINNENPDLSGLVFSMFDENGNEKDGFLRIGDVYNLKLPVEMVVLSGCRTGLGKEIKGEGLMGLTRGFMYAGARRVTVSLWDVNDEATAGLMSQFYREMLGAKKLSPAAGLRQAQIKMLQSKVWENPYYWSTFTLQGEPK